MPPTQSDLAHALADQARRHSLLVALRMRPEMTISQLGRLLSVGRYAKELALLTVAELRDSEPHRSSVVIGKGESVEGAILRVFRGRQAMWLTSGFFIGRMGLERWVAQAALVDLADAGLLERRGVTSGTCYRLVHPGRGHRR